MPHPAHHLAAIALLALATAGASAQAGHRVDVERGAYAGQASTWYYTPEEVAIAPGDSVTWHNPRIHVQGPADEHPTACVRSTDRGQTRGECPWTSFKLPPDSSHTVTFSEDGTFQYVCLIHTWMVGTVVVGSGDPPAAEPEPSPQPEPSPEPSPQPSPEPSPQPEPSPPPPSPPATAPSPAAPSPAAGSPQAEQPSPDSPPDTTPPSPDESPSPDPGLADDADDDVAGDAVEVPGDVPGTPSGTAARVVATILVGLAAASLFAVGTGRVLG